jgi:hypothetical protein
VLFLVMLFGDGFDGWWRFGGWCCAVFRCLGVLVGAAWPCLCESFSLWLWLGSRGVGGL